MKNFTFILLVSLIYGISFSPVLGQHKFSLSLSTAPTYQLLDSRSIITIPDVNGGPASPVEIHTQRTGLGYLVGLMARYAFSDRFSVSTGLWSNRLHYRTPTIATTPDLTTNPNNVQIIATASNTYAYQIPLLISYQLPGKRLSPYFSAGALITFPSVVSFEGGGTYRAANRKVYVYPTLGAGISYQLNAHFSIIAQPTFTYILPNGTFVSYSNYQIGVQTQLVYTLR